MSTNPSLRMSRQKPPPSEGKVIRRIVIGLAAITNLVAALIATIVAAGVRWFGRDKIRGWHILLAGIVATVIGFWQDWTGAYGRPWRELVELIVDDPLNPQAALRLVTRHGAEWVKAQLPFAICLALLVAGIYLTWRDRYRKTWKAAEAGRPASARTVAAAKKKLDNKAAKAGPVQIPDKLMLPLGVDTMTVKPVNVPASSFRTHAVVVGPTGLGKTEALERIIWAMSAQPAAKNLNVPAIVVDMKGDPAFADWMEATAHTVGRPFHKITLSASTSTSGYVALGGRSADEVADMVYEMVFAGDATLNQHYATLSRRLLQVACRALVDLAGAGTLAHGGCAWRVTLPDLARLCSLSELRFAMADVSAPVAERITRYLDDVKAADNENDVGDVRDRLSIITETAIGDILARPGLDLREAIEAGAFVCFSLDAAASPESARVMGRLAVQDISATFGALAGAGWSTAGGLCPIVLDEFSALASPKVGDLFARVRSAGGAVILSTQDLGGDLTAVSPQFAATVRTNANVWMVLRQTRGELAESIAQDIGTVKAWKETVQVEDDWDPLGGLHAASGVGSLREVDEYVIHPNEIRSLAQGAAILMVKVPAGSLHKHDAATEMHRLHIAQAPKPAPVAPQQAVQPPPSPQSTPVTDVFAMDVEPDAAGTIWDDDDMDVPAPSPGDER